MDTLNEKVVFRKEYDPYVKKWGYLAIFPEDKVSRPDRVTALPFHYNGDEAFFECYTEISLGYMYKQKIIHKKDPVIPKLKETVERYIVSNNPGIDDYEIIVAEKIMR